MGQGQRVAGPNRAKTYQIFAARPGLRGTQNAIAVDQDENVVSLVLTATKQIENVRSLGLQVHAPGDFGCASRIPSDQVLLQLRRVSRTGTNWKLWVAVTAGFRKADTEDDIQHVHNFLYSFKESNKCDGELITESYPAIEELIIDDINGDGLDYIVAKYNEAISAYSPWVSIWRIDLNGVARPISLRNIIDGPTLGGKLEIRIIDAKFHRASLYVEEKLAMGQGRWKKLAKSYGWDSASQQYKLLSELKLEEAPIP
jgi:hypothetical protein